MKKLFFLTFLITAMACKQSGTDNESSHPKEELHKWAKEADFFNLQKNFNELKSSIPKEDSLYFEALLAGAYNQPETSNKAIDAFFEIHKITIKDSLAIKLLETKLVNQINLFEYQNALRTNDTLQKLYAPQFEFDKLEDLRNSYHFLKSLENTPVQEIEITSDASLPITKDKAGLPNLEVTFGAKKKNFVFNTGANFSVIQRSVAEELGLKIISSNFMTANAAGRKVNTHLAVADSMSIGPIVLRNVVFLVFKDADLTFPPIDYEMKGILGFPIIRAFEEIRITKDSVFVPEKAVDYKLYNLAFDGLIPLAKVEYKGDALPFQFETGSATTTLYAKFYERYKTDIEANYPKTNLSVPGGQYTIGGYLLDAVDLTVGGSTVNMKDVQLFPERISAADLQYGNLGQDFINKFETMIISFKSASLLFR